MARPILVSVPRSLLLTDDPERKAYLQTIADLDLGIELFTSPSQGPSGHDPLSLFFNEEAYNESAVERAHQYGIEVETVHATPLKAGCSPDGAKSCVEKVLDSQFGHRDDDNSPAESERAADGPDRYAYCNPSLFVFHPPRTYANEDHDLQQRRKQLVATLGNAAVRLEEHELVDHAPTLTIENVCPRGPFEYLLTDASDVTAFRTAQTELQAEQPEDVDVPEIEFTLDVGHALEPFAMLEAIGTPAHVHLHGSVLATDTAAKTSLRDKYRIDSDIAIGPTEPTGEIQHLPPQEGQHRLPDVIDALTDANYDGSVVFELAPPYRTEEVLKQTVDSLRSLGW